MEFLKSIKSSCKQLNFLHFLITLLPHIESHFCKSAPIWRTLHPTFLPLSAMTSFPKWALSCYFILLLNQSHPFHDLICPRPVRSWTNIAHHLSFHSTTGTTVVIQIHHDCQARAHSSYSLELVPLFSFPSVQLKFHALSTQQNKCGQKPKAGYNQHTSMPKPPSYWRESEEAGWYQC